jgi:hypothetical protein
MKLNSKLKGALKEVQDKDAFLVAHESAWEVIRYLLREEISSIEKEFWENEYDLNWNAEKVALHAQRSSLKKMLSYFED